MPSLIQGYNYDIFISYRQKDNKHDGWVTEFVENLKGELESTFKEEISVYFDINPHDGLLETHDVDESLKEKLRCLIFIPVISRTYCDPRSFAWEHEFKAFIDIASQDQYGLKVKLPNGNVASRMLPVRIYDLDASDVKLCESMLGGFLRGVDFIYRSSGVNRPLLPKEENPQENLNHTNYRDQINKVANSVKEIITALAQDEHKPAEEEKSEVSKRDASTVKRVKPTKIAAIFSIILLLIIIGIILIPKLIKPEEELIRSIAVLPFIDDSPDKDNTHIINGVMEEILIDLQKISDLRVFSRNSVEQFRGGSRPATPEIARKLGVNYIVEGSGQKYGNKFRLRVQLIEAVNDRHLWAESYEKEVNDPEDYFLIQSDIAKEIAAELKAHITPDEERMIEKIPTKSLTAYDFFQRGREEYMKAMWVELASKEGLAKAEYLFREALKYDSTFAPAYCWLASVYQEKHLWESYLSENINILDSVLILANKAISLDDQLSDAYTVRGDYYTTMEKRSQAEADYDRAIKLNPNDDKAYAGKGFLFDTFDDIKTLENFLKAASLHRGPLLPQLLRKIGLVFMSAGFTNKAEYYYHEALKLDGDSLQHYFVLATLAFCTENYEEAVDFQEKAYRLKPESIIIINALGQYNMFAGLPEESLKYYEKMLEGGNILSEESLFSKHRLGWAYWKNGDKEKARYYLNEQIKYCNRMKELGRVYGDDVRIFYDLAGVYAFLGDRQKAYENLGISKDYKDKLGLSPSLYGLSLIRHDPLFESIRNDPEFQQMLLEYQTRFQANHERVGTWLEENKML